MKLSRHSEKPNGRYAPIPCRLKAVLLSGGQNETPFADLQILSQEWLSLHNAPCLAPLDAHDPETAVRACRLCNELERAEANGRQDEVAIREMSAGHRALYDGLHSLPGDGRTALCLSGGGVRSAAFNLGILQGLAGLRLLHRFTYLSTVSGGGYIGAWLTAWRARRRLRCVLDGMRWPPRDGCAPPTELTNLRHDTSYLTPQAGVLSADFWAAAGLMLRNVLLNNVIVLPLVLAFLLLPKMVLAAIRTGLLPAPIYFAWAGVLLLLLGWVCNAVRRPSWYPREDSEKQRGSYLWTPRASIFFVLAGAALISIGTAAGFSAKDAWPGALFHRFVWLQKIAPPDLLTAAIETGLLAAIAAFWIALSAVRLKPSQRIAEDVGATLCTVPFTAWGALNIKAAIAGAVGAAFVGWGMLEAGSSPPLSGAAQALLLCVGPLWVVTGFAIADAVYLTLTYCRPSLPDGRTWNDRWGDEEREWVARTNGYLAMIASSIGLLFAASLFGFAAWRWMGSSWGWWKAAFGAAGVVTSGLASVGLEASSLTGPRGTPPGKRWIPVNLILAVATPVFIGLALTLLSAVIDVCFQADPLYGDAGDAGAELAKCLLFIPALIALAIVAARYVNINRFSLHDIYRLRLIREFLGATNRDRKEDPWTGFNTSDDVPLAELQPERLTACQTATEAACLYPVINATLNTVGSNMLQWQERKGESFVFTPHFSGAAAINAYRKTEEYAGGVLLGSAMSISGAAASPNMGYSSIPGLSLLLTIFNVRLGVWAGNPLKGKFKERGPAHALRPLFSEAFARTTDSTDYVYLSDGGHFDNLGLYEMLRRRCRYIVVSDAGCDPDYEFADLGRAARRAAIDLGVQIAFERFDLKKRCDTPFSGPYWAWGTVRYPESATPGRILYIKAGFQGKAEPPDVRAYALTNPAFPHDQTTNQFFDEAQFESYRALGQFIIGALAGRHFKTRGPDFERLFTLGRPPILEAGWHFLREARRKLKNLFPLLRYGRNLPFD